MFPLFILHSISDAANFRHSRKLDMLEHCGNSIYLELKTVVIRLPTTQWYFVVINSMFEGPSIPESAIPSFPSAFSPFLSFGRL